MEKIQSVPLDKTEFEIWEKLVEVAYLNVFGRSVFSFGKKARSNSKKTHSSEKIFGRCRVKIVQPTCGREFSATEQNQKQLALNDEQQNVPRNIFSN